MYIFNTMWIMNVERLVHKLAEHYSLWPEFNNMENGPARCPRRLLQSDPAPGGQIKSSSKSLKKRWKMIKRAVGEGVRIGGCARKSAVIWLVTWWYWYIDFFEDIGPSCALQTDDETFGGNVWDWLIEKDLYGRGALLSVEGIWLTCWSQKAVGILRQQCAKNIKPRSLPRKFTEGVLKQELTTDKCTRGTFSNKIQSEHVQPNFQGPI